MLAVLLAAGLLWHIAHTLPAQKVLSESAAELPVYNVTLRPVFRTNSTQIGALDISISLSAPALGPLNTLVELPLWFGNVPSQQYSIEANNPILAHDDFGEVPLRSTDSEANNVRRWSPLRPIKSDVELSMRALPRDVDVHTPIGPRLDLREQAGGGLLGAGLSMLPVPPRSQDAQYDIHFKWDRSDSPDGTQVASSLGDEGETHVEGKLELIMVALFAVGTDLHRYPQAEEDADFGLFYFGDEKDVPINVRELAEYVLKFYKVASFYFKEPAPAPYRVFLRSSPRGFGGAAFSNAFMLEYHPSVNVTSRELELLLMHEIVHNWPLLELTSGEDVAWYNEGIAEYYKVFLPYRFGLWSEETFLNEFNKVATAYCTSPAIQAHMTNQEAASLAWHDPDAQRVPYLRGFMFHFLMDQRIRYLSFIGPKDLDNSLETVVLDLLDHRRKGLTYRLEDWAHAVNSSVGGWAGSDADGYELALFAYTYMSLGEILPLAPSPWNGEEMPFELNITALEIVELGFNVTSFATRTISDVVPGSRAEAAGLQDGDEVVASPVMYWQVADDIERNMSLTLRRGEVEWNVTYWPRSWEKVQCLLYKR